jgi:polysaccharide pyruvyl transferase WcaK-like protein
MDAIAAGMRCEKLHFFARERRTADLLATHLPPQVDLCLDHDTAFSLSRQDLLDVLGTADIPAGRYLLVVDREDDEVARRGAIRRNNAVVLDPAYYATSFAHWLRIHAHAKEIVSNRLHSCIAGVLLGKPVTVMSGSYHKNRSMWEFSLRERGATWQDYAPDSAGVSGSPVRHGILHRLRSSWKVQRLLHCAMGVPQR